MVIKMATIEVRCSKCGSIKVIKHGRTPIGKQRYQCKDCKNSFILDYTYNAYNPGTKETIIKMTANASGIRDISRVLGISTDTVMKTVNADTRNPLRYFLVTSQQLRCYFSGSLNSH